MAKPFVIFFFLLFLSAACLSVIEASVESTCTKVAARKDPKVDYDYCVGRLNRHHGSTDADTWRLAQNAAELSIAYSEATAYDIRDMLSRKPAEPPATLSALNACLDLYKQIETTVAQADTSINFRQYADAKKKLRSAVGMAGACEASFGKAGAKSLLTAQNAESQGLSILSLAITSLMG